MGQALDEEQVRALVEFQIGDARDATNLHRVDLRTALVPPRRITVIERLVRDDEFDDRLTEVWLVLVEGSETEDGYRIVTALDGSSFGLACAGLTHDEHLVLVGWYGDFMETFEAM
jgi:hypothetical protein